MKAIRLRKNKTVSTSIGIVCGTIMSLIISFCGAAILTQMVLSGKIGESAINIGCKVVLAIGTMIGSILSVLLVKEKKLVASIATGASVFAVLISCTALMLGGQYHGVPTTLLVTIGSSILVGTIFSKKKGNSLKRIKKYRFVQLVQFYNASK